MIFDEDNLREGLETFTKPTTSRYKNALKLYESMVIKAGANPVKAIEEILEQAVEGLSDETTKLKTARDAAGVTLWRRGESLKAESPIAQPPTPLRAWMEKRAVKKVRASKQPSSPKASKLLVVLVSVCIGIVLMYGSQLYQEAVYHTETGWWTNWPLIPLGIALSLIVHSLFAKRPESHDDDDDDDEEPIEPNQPGSLKEKLGFTNHSA